MYIIIRFHDTHIFLIHICIFPSSSIESISWHESDSDNILSKLLYSKNFLLVLYLYHFIINFCIFFTASSFSFFIYFCSFFIYRIILWCLFHPFFNPLIILYLFYSVCECCCFFKLLYISLLLLLLLVILEGEYCVNNYYYLCLINSLLLLLLVIIFIYYRYITFWIVFIIIFLVFDVWLLFVAFF